MKPPVDKLDRSVGKSRTRFVELKNVNAPVWERQRHGSLGKLCCALVVPSAAMTSSRCAIRLVHTHLAALIML